MEETMRTLRPEKQRRRPKIAVLLVTLCAAALLSYAALTGTLAAPKQLAGARTQLPAAAASAPSFFGWAAAAVYRTFCPYVSDCDVEYAALNSSALPTTVARVALWREPTPRYSSTMVEVLEPPRTSHSRPRPASSPFRTHPPLHSPLARSGSPASPHPVSALTRTARCTRPRPARSPPSPASSIFRKSQIRPPTPFWSTTPQGQQHQQRSPRAPPRHCTPAPPAKRSHTSTARGSEPQQRRSATAPASPPHTARPRTLLTFLM